VAFLPKMTLADPMISQVVKMVPHEMLLLWLQMIRYHHHISESIQLPEKSISRK
jgi:hypothetical protein